MPDDPVTTPPFDASRTIVGALLGLVGHGLALAAAFVAASLSTPSPGGTFEDLAAAVATLLLGEIIIGLLCLIAGGVLFARGRRDIGLSLVGGWAMGAIVLWIVLRSG